MKDLISLPSESGLVFLAKKTSNMGSRGLCQVSLASVQRNSWARKRGTLARVLQSRCRQLDKRC